MKCFVLMGACLALGTISTFGAEKLTPKPASVEPATKPSSPTTVASQPNFGKLKEVPIKDDPKAFKENFTLANEVQTMLPGGGWDLRITKIRYLNEKIRTQFMDQALAEQNHNFNDTVEGWLESIKKPASKKGEATIAPQMRDSLDPALADNLKESFQHYSKTKALETHFVFVPVETNQGTFVLLVLPNPLFRKGDLVLILKISLEDVIDQKVSVEENDTIANMFLLLPEGQPGQASFLDTLLNVRFGADRIVPKEKETKKNSSSKEESVNPSPERSEVIPGLDPVLTPNPIQDL